MSAPEVIGSGRVGVVGLGLIGGSILQALALALARGTGGEPTIGFDLGAETVAAASAAGHRVAGSVEELATAADLVIVAVPPARTAAVVVEVLEANQSVAVIDVASVKAAVVEAVRERAPGEIHRYLPAHPLAGSESGGWSAARPDLLDGAIWAICPSDDGTPLDSLRPWTPFLDQFEARLVVCDPSDHDAAVARTSHVAHIAAQVLAGSIDHGPPELAALLSGRGFRDMTRIAGSDAELWRQIIAMNGAEVSAAIGGWIDELERIREAIDRDASEAVTDGWGRGRAMLDLVNATRWAEPGWERRAFAAPAWEELRDLSRSGRVVRRLEWDGDGITLDVSTEPRT